MGLASGRVSDEQLADGHGYESPPYLNPHGARLNTARMDGWRSSSSSWLRIDFGTKQKIISISVQQHIPDSSNTNSYKIYYGDSMFVKKAYTGVQANDGASSAVVCLL